jgi:hypothetical protein
VYALARDNLTVMENSARLLPLGTTAGCASRRWWMTTTIRGESLSANERLLRRVRPRHRLGGCEGARYSILWTSRRRLRRGVFDPLYKGQAICRPACGLVSAVLERRDERSRCFHGARVLGGMSPCRSRRRCLGRRPVTFRAALGVIPGGAASTPR